MILCAAVHGKHAALKGGRTALRRRLIMKKTLAVFLVLVVLLSFRPGLGESYISEGKVIFSAEAGLTLAIPAAFEYIGENQGLSGYRDGNTGLMVQITGFSTMADFLADFEGTGLSLSRETALSSGSLQVEILWADHPNYVAFIGAKDLRTEGSPVMQLVVARNDESQDLSSLVRNLAGSFRSVRDTLQQDEDPETWDNYALLDQVGLGIALPRSMMFEVVWTEDGAGAYILLSNGICRIEVNFFLCTIGELAVMNGFTSHDYEIYQSNAYSFWQFRPLDARYPDRDSLAFPGKDGTWMLLSIRGGDGTDPETVWYYINQICAAVFSLV